MDFQTPPPAGGFGAGPSPGRFGPIEGKQVSMSSDRLAVVALVLGALSIPGGLCCFGGIPLGIVAMVLGHKAQKKIALHPDLFHGGRSATVGFWLGVAGLALSGLYFSLNLILMFLK